MKSNKTNFIYNSILSLSQVIFPLIVFPYVARVIYPEGVGEVTFVESICRYAILFAGLGIPIYGVREVAKCKKDESKLNTLFSELVVIHFAVTAVILIFYFVSIFAFSKLYQNIEFYYLGVLMILSNVFVIEWYFQGIGQFKFITVRNLIIRSLLTLGVFFLVKDREDAILYFGLTVLTSILNGVVNFIYAQKTIKFDFNIKWINLKRHFTPLFFIFSSIAFISIYTLLDTIMLGFLADEKAVGIYTTGLKVSRVPMTFIGALGVVLIPKLSEHFHDNDMVEFNRLIDKSINFVVIFSVPVIFFLIGSSSVIIELFAGPNFFEASIILEVLSVLSLLIGLSNVFGMQVLTPMAKDKYLTYSVVFGTVISLALNFILIPVYRELGAAISNVIAEIAVTAAAIYFAFKFISFKVDFTFTIKTILISIPILLIPKVVAFMADDLLMSLFYTVMLTGVYYAFMQMVVVKSSIVVDITNKFFKINIK